MPSVPPKVANTASQLTANLLSAALDKPARKAGEDLGNFLSGLNIPKHAVDFFGNFGTAAKDATLGALTGTAPATEIGQYKSANYRPSSPGRIPDNNPIGLTEEYFREAPRAESRQVANAGRYDADVMSPAGASIYEATGLGPETVGNIAAVAGTGAALGLAGWGFGQLFGGSKPRSDYALAVQRSNPYMGGSGNQNIDAAAASAYYQQQTAEMKFRHQMALQQMRQEAQTPGVQGYGGGLDSHSPYIGKEMDIARSIYGTGLRM